MSNPDKSNQDKLTFEGLQKFLQWLGFEQPAKVDNALAFHHPGSGTILVLSVPEDGRTVRSADLLSVITRLESAGLVGESEIRQFKSGRLPKAS